jgi:hypothetical protein
MTTSLTEFSTSFGDRLRASPLAVEDDMHAPIEDPSETIDQKIGRFEELIEKLHTVVDKMGEAEAEVCHWNVHAPCIT